MTPTTNVASIRVFASWANRVKLPNPAVKPAKAIMATGFQGNAMRKLAVPSSPRLIGRGATNLPDSQHRMNEITGTTTAPTVGSGAAR